MLYDHGFGFGLLPKGRKLPRLKSSGHETQKIQNHVFLKMPPKGGFLKFHISRSMGAILNVKPSLVSLDLVVSKMVRENPYLGLQCPFFIFLKSPSALPHPNRDFLGGMGPSLGHPHPPLMGRIGPEMVEIDSPTRQLFKMVWFITV